MHTIVCMNIRCSKTYTSVHPVYRIFLDGQLIVERRFWPETPDFYIQEQLTLSNSDGSTHSVKIKNVFTDRGEIFLHDVSFFDGDNRNTVAIDHSFDSETEFTFVLPKR